MCHRHIYTYTGREYDTESGLYYYRARYYDANNGRFLQEDPIGLYLGDINFYIYVGNNPMILVDPYGLDWLKNLSDFSAGFGDTITFGITRKVRQAIGADYAVDYCSGWYTGGTWGGAAWWTAMGGAIAARSAGYEVVFRAYPNAGGGGVSILKEGGRRIISADWHKFVLRGKDVFRPHIDIPGVVKHWPWR